MDDVGPKKHYDSESDKSSAPEEFDHVADVRERYAGPASYLYIEQRRSVGRPRKKKGTRGRPKMILKQE